MPRRLPNKIDERVMGLIKDAADGIGIEALDNALAGQISRRSLQRRLSEWVARGVVAAQGKTRSTRYLVPDSEHAGKKEPEAIPSTIANAGTN
jgi:hypothetical protein